jgi:hypothetical protein
MIWKANVRIRKFGMYTPNSVACISREEGHVHAGEYGVNMPKNKTRTKLPKWQKHL